MNSKKHTKLVVNILFIISIMATTISYAQKKNNWIPKNYKITGTWSFVSNNTGSYLVFSDDFKTSRGPDVKVYLSKKSIDDIDKRESVDVGGIFLGEIEFSGSQEFKIPENVNLEDYKSIVIHCQKYSAVWGGSDIR